MGKLNTLSMLLAVSVDDTKHDFTRSTCAGMLCFCTRCIRKHVAYDK